VVDFIDIGPWPVFNLADSAIVVGITMLIMAIAFGGVEKDARRPERPEQAAAPEGPADGAAPQL
jgi:signal peptidase II